MHIKNLKRVKLNRKFKQILILLFIIITLFYGLVNYSLDIYGVFSDNLLLFHFYESINLRINKINYLNVNKNKYDSFLIGGSRFLIFKEADFNKYSNHHFFNLCGIRSDMYDNLITIKYLIKTQKVKSIIVQIGIDDLYLYENNKENILRRSHYLLEKDNKYLYYFNYLFSNDINHIFKKIFGNIYLKKYYPEFMNEVFFENYRREILISNNKEKYYSSEFNDKNFIHLPVFKNPKIHENINALKEIKKITTENNIELIIFTSPVNHHLMRRMSKDDIDNYLNEISKVTSFYNFSYLNSITLNDENYYDYLHYRKNVADLILAKIYSDKTVSIPGDFGIFIKN